MFETRPFERNAKPNNGDVQINKEYDQQREDEVSPPFLNIPYFQRFVLRYRDHMTIV